jgi:hypothetical protein
MAKQETDYTGQASWNQPENWQRTQTQQTLVTMQPNSSCLLSLEVWKSVTYQVEGYQHTCETAEGPWISLSVLETPMP